MFVEGLMIRDNLILWLSCQCFSSFVYHCVCLLCVFVFLQVFVFSAEWSDSDCLRCFAIPLTLGVRLKGISLRG